MKKFGISLVTLALVVMPWAGHAAAATAPVNLIANESMETSTNGTTPDGWLNGAWGTNTTTFSYQNTGRTGSHSLKIDTTSYTSGSADWYFADVAVTPGQAYTYSHYYMSDAGGEIDAQVTDTTGAVSYYYVTTTSASPSAWTKASGQFTAPANAKTVTFFQALSQVGYVQIDDASLTTYAPSQFTRGIVSLTFDDGWRDQYTNGRPLLNQYSLPATYYLLTSTVNDSQYMTTAMMQTLGSEGNELASHTIH